MNYTATVESLHHIVSNSWASLFTYCLTFFRFVSVLFVNRFYEIVMEEVC